MAAQQRKTGLGRGLGALLNDSADIPERNSEVETSRVESPTKSKESGNISTVNVDTIEMNPFQPRTDFDPQALQELSESISLQGLIQPITVRKIGENAYQLISGERRYRASKLAGITEIPAYIRTANDQQMLEMALIENIQRENLNAIEVALSFQRMIEECNLKQEELGERVSKNRSTVTNYLRLLKLPPVIQAAIRDGELTMGHARALINVGEVDKQLYIFKLIVDLGYQSPKGHVGRVTVRQEDAFGNFELKARGVEIMLCEQRCNRVDDVGVVELDRGQVDRDADMVRPAGGLGNGGAQDELADLADHSAFLG